MKSTYAIAAALLFSIGAFAQKDELKSLRKITDKPMMEFTAADVAEGKKVLSALESKMASATPEQQIDYHFYKGKIMAFDMKFNPATAMQSFDVVTENLNKVVELEKSGKKKYTKEIEDMIYPEIKAGLIAAASKLGKEQKFSDVVPLYEAVYSISPKDTLHLYNAAANAVNAKDYDTALRNFEKLDKLGFTGAVTYFTAKNMNGEVEYYGDKKTRDNLVMLKTHTEPSIYKEPSKKAEIVKNIALIYIYKKDTANAMKAIANAKKADPNDTSLLMAEASIMYEAGDMDGYKKAIQNILDKGSKDPILYFNLGVIAAQSGQNAEAEAYYQKAIEIKPDYPDPYQNLAALQLAGEDKIVEEMNNAKTTNKRYDELKKQRDDKYRKALKYLEQGYKAVPSPQNENIKGSLGTMYQALEMDAEYKALKSK